MAEFVADSESIGYNVGSLGDWFISSACVSLSGMGCQFFVELYKGGKREEEIEQGVFK